MELILTITLIIVTEVSTTVISTLVHAKLKRKRCFISEYLKHSKHNQGVNFPPYPESL